MGDTPDPAAIARRLTKAQRASVADSALAVAVLRECCATAHCWATHDVDRYFGGIMGDTAPGCAECRSMYDRVRAVLEQEARDE
jgi:hypothetical protein